MLLVDAFNVGETLLCMLMLEKYVYNQAQNAENTKYTANLRISKIMSFAQTVLKFVWLN